MKLGIFLPNWIGDAVMATPALRTLRREFADAEIIGIARPNVADTLRGVHFVDRFMQYDPRGKDARQRGARFVYRLRSERLDSVLLFTHSFRTGWLAYLSGASRRVGMKRSGRGWLLTERVLPKPQTEPHPAIDEYLRLARRMGAESVSRQTELTVTEGEAARLEQFWNTRPAEFREAGTICLNPGGAFGSSKHWPVELFAELARQIVMTTEHTVLVLCGPAERDEARAIASQADQPRVLHLADMEPSIGLTKAAVREASVLVTTDSGPRHFAQPFGVPVVTLFGPTHKAWSETYFNMATHLQLNLGCGPCQQRVCPLKHHRCMRDIPVAWVLRAVTAHLSRSRQPMAA